VAGERVNIDLTLQNGTLVVASNLPNADACSVGGSSWINYFNYADGLAVYNSSNSAVGIQQTTALAVGLSVLRLPGGKTVVISSNSDATRKTLDVAFSVTAPGGRRVSWRELN
jgi:type IV pilus assembly protein PilY1